MKKVVIVSRGRLKGEFLFDGKVKDKRPKFKEIKSWKLDSVEPNLVFRVVRRNKGWKA